MKVSIIFPVRNEGENVRNTLDSLFSMKMGTPFEIIIVNDGSVDHSCDFIKDYPKKQSITLIETAGIGAANARNEGAKHAGGDILIFCDAHLQFEDRWLDQLIVPLLLGQTDAVSPAIGSIHNADFIGYGQTLKSNLRIKWNEKPHGISETAILPGACLAITRTVFEAVDGFEQGFYTWGHEDVELSIKLWLFGFRCHVLPSVKVDHLFRRELPYEVSYDDLYYNILRMAYSHFNTERILKCKKLIPSTRGKEIESKVVHDGALVQRQEYMKKRRRTDDWYFHRFNIPF